MALLLDDLLDVSRITRGALTLRKEAVALKEVVNGAAETARPVLDARAHELDVKLPARPLYVEADRLRLAQVLANLPMKCDQVHAAGRTNRTDCGGR
jgi:signal transduction histidine kinase